MSKYVNEYTCQGGVIFQMRRELHIYKIFIRNFVKLILSNFYKIHAEKFSFLPLSATRVKRSIWNQHIFVNVHVAQILIKTIILKKRNRILTIA